MRAREEIRAIAEHQVQRALGAVRVKRAQRRRQPGQSELEARADRQLVRNRRRIVAHHVAAAPRLVEDATRLDEQAVTRRSQRDPARGPREQRRRQLILEALDPVAKRGRRERYRLGGDPEAEVGRSRIEATQRFEVR